MRVLVTRPAAVAFTLCEKIRAWGAEPIAFPVVEFQNSSRPETLGKAIHKLAQSYMAIFVSRPAVQFSIPVIQAYWQAPRTLPKILWASVGPGTAEELEKHGISSVLYPNAPPYESESFVALPELEAKAIEGKNIFIFRGNGGRELLSQTLSKRGASVHCIESYQRSVPKLSTSEIETAFHSAPIDVILSTSTDCLRYLIKLVGQLIPELREIPIVVIGLRMFELALKLEFKHPILATGADDASMIKALEKVCPHPALRATLSRFTGEGVGKMSVLEKV